MHVSDIRRYEAGETQPTLDDPDEKHLIRELIEGILLKHDAKQWIHSA